MLRNRFLYVLILATVAGGLALAAPGGRGGPAASAGGGGAPAPAPSLLEGRARAIDGDTLEIAGVRVRLQGIDAPELSAPACHRADGSPWDCAAWARETLARLLRGRTVRCTPQRSDRYGRLIARCEAGGQDLGAAMLRAGAAVAYLDHAADYAEAEKEALFAGRGLWAGSFERPEAVRARLRGAAPPAPAAPQAGRCVIKGNISASGARIYHLPGQADYAVTRIDESRGERWFCSEAEARAAGWRPAAR